MYDESMSTFFRNVSPLKADMPPNTEINDLKARAVCVDTEGGVLESTLRGPLKDLFDRESTFLAGAQGASGAGNNWAHGHYGYGEEHGGAFLECLRRQTERCDSLQSFFLLHSLGGGTGSGLGTRLLGMLEDEYSGVYRFAASVFPQEGGGDVVTGDYNAVLALNQLTMHADAVLPLDNDRLAQISSKSAEAGGAAAGAGVNAVKGRRGSGGAGGSGGGGFDEMNAVVARLLTDLTASMRFPGDLNTDLNEITTNLVPFPRLHYLCPSLAPLGKATRHTSGNAATRIRALFRDCFSPPCSLISRGGADVKSSSVLACGVFMRGKGVPISDVNAEVARLQAQLRMPSWNREGFKIGLCSTPGMDGPASLMALTNSSVINAAFRPLHERFTKLYRRKANLHHYTQYCEESEFEEAAGGLKGLIEEYEEAGMRGGGGLLKGEERIWDVNNDDRTGRAKVAF